MPDWTTLASTDELQPGDRKADFIDDEPVLLVRIDDNYFCIADACSHDGQPLGDGPITGEDITCSRHGARFSLATGDALCMPATEPVATYAVRVADGQVQARLGGTDDVTTTSDDPPPAKIDDDADTTDSGTPAATVDSPEPDVDSSATDDDGIQASAMLEAL
ncbi:MAG: non-heme iron oxygenase ferredoxin subunit, partial [Planctomycetota bacterium]|nr:non-heme iron oxygenase ferredoxin subunit [Planctomycetota bacterium]